MSQGGRLIGVTAALAAAWACASAPPAVPVTGEVAAIQSLSGRWAGRYESRATGRYGSIAFELEAGSDTARGEVQMIPAGRSEPLRGLDVDHTGIRIDESRTPRFLTIRFVGVSDGKVRGCLDPYRDPDTGVVLLTAFRGVVRGDSIVGTYESRSESSGVLATGHWWVARRRGD
jgi:hypothetical protein